jgi:MFS family permease
MSESQQETARVQRRTLGTLAASVVLGGLGISSAIATGGLLVAEVTGSDAASGLSQTAVVLGGAVLAVPLARISDGRGRRVGLASGYLLGMMGAAIVIAAAAAGLGWLLLLGLLLFGAAMAAGMQSRFGATDLAAPEHLGRDLSLVLWMTAVGAVLGPNLVSPAASLGRALGLPELAGGFVLAASAFLLAAAVVLRMLRPDPLLLSRAAAQDASAVVPPGQPALSLADSARVVLASPPATLGILAVVLAHASMIGLMAMTPLHLDRGGASLTVVGLVISIHIAGMYFFTPVMGALADRLGPHAVILAGASVIAASGVVAAVAPGSASGVVAAALFMLGLGWSACLVAGSALLTAATPLEVRPRVQGLSDLAMGVGGAVAGASAGIVFGFFSFTVLGLLVVLVISPVALASFSRRFRSPVVDEPVGSPPER